MKQGIVVKNISNQYDCLVGNEIITCVPRGKFRYDKKTPLVGDKVVINPKEKIISEILPRKNELSRPNVANVDIALVITSVKKPDLSLALLDKQLVMIEKNNIKPIIVFTKIDLLSVSEYIEFKELMNYYKSIGYTVLINNNKWRLRFLLHHKLVVLTGQTGAGKSSLINSLCKDLNIKTSPISEALGRGVHTTRNTEIYSIHGINFIDTPGFSSLDLKGIEPEKLKDYFKEFQFIKCQFKDCTHQKNCKLVEAVEKGIIKKSRYDNYLRFLKECYETSSKLFK